MNIDDATSEDFERALLKLRDDQESGINFQSAHAMLRTQCRAEGSTLTTAQLAEAQQWKSPSTAVTQYGKLGKQIGSYLDFATPPKSSKDKKPMWWMALSMPVDAEDRWVLRPALKQAMVSLKWDR